MLTSLITSSMTQHIFPYFSNNALDVHLVFSTSWRRKPMERKMPEPVVASGEKERKRNSNIAAFACRGSLVETKLLANVPVTKLVQSEKHNGAQSHHFRHAGTYLDNPKTSAKFMKILRRVAQLGAEGGRHRADGGRCIACKSSCSEAELTCTYRLARHTLRSPLSKTPCHSWG